jgi:hypothetical protein
MIPTIIQACSSLERSVGVNVREPASAMTDPMPQPEPWTVERQRLHEWLERNAGRLAELYASAVRLLDDTAFPGRLPLIAVAVREIASGLTRGTGTPESLPGGEVTFWSGLLARARMLFRGHPPAQRALHPVMREWIQVTGWFENRVHADEDELRTQFARFEDGLRAIADGSVTAVKEIDRILESGPPLAATLDRVLPMLKGAEELRYFFGRIDDPAWIEPLEQHGFFAHPPEPAPGEDPRGRTYPRWPASLFLARMAARPVAQEAVARIAERIETTNLLVHEDLTDAALRLPPALSAGLLPGLVRGLGPASTSLLPSKIGALAEGLARSGQVVAARRLFGALLAHTRVDPLRVSRVLDRHLAGIVSGLGVDALLVLSQALDRTIRLARTGRPEKRKDGQRYLQDHSEVWSPELRGEARDGAKGLLIATLRGVAERLVDENPAAIASVVEVLEGRRWWIFHRLALHVLGRSASHTPHLAVARILDRPLFDGFGREYRLLAQRGFGFLTAAQQSEWLGWIDAGPHPDEISADVERRRWQWRRLAPFAGTLSGVWNERVGRLVQEFGAPPLAEGGTAGPSVPVGWASPLSEDKIRSTSVEELAAFLRSWAPTTLDPRVQPQGLAERITRVVAEEPGRFADGARLLRDLEPTYVRAVLAGLDAALREQRTFAWGPVLELAHWVAERPVGQPEPLWDGWKDPSWAWTQGAVVRLLTLGLQGGTGGLSPAMRPVVWELVEALNRDPTPERRAECLGAAIQYALWVRRETGGSHPPGRPPDDLPEVRPILDAAVASGVAADHEELGRNLPGLVHLRESWVRSNLARLFPDGDGAMELWRAAWHGYVQSGAPPEDRVLSVLQGTYRRALEVLGADPEGGARLSIDQEALAEHLALLCGRGTLEAQGQEALLERFLDTAGLKVRRHFFWFVGHRLEEHTDQAVLKRFQALWEKRHAGAKGNPASRSEVSTFASWFVSGRFDEGWALEQLERVLRSGSGIDREDLVVRRLAAVAPHYPLPAARCLALLAGLTRERASAFGWIEDVKPILAAVLRSEDRAARREAAEAFRRLVALGFRAHELVHFSDDLDDPVAIPYFTVHDPMTLAEVRQRLPDASDPEGDRLLALVLREAKDRDVWKLTTPEEVVRRWGQVEPHLGGRREFWALRLNQWHEQGLPVR